MLLRERGHEVSGIALDPEPGSLFSRADLTAELRSDIRQDIRDGPGTSNAVVSVAPDAVIHMAAQPLVRASYTDPRGTYDTNVMGTLSVLEGIAAAETVRAAVMVTTDKVYRNSELDLAYREEDPLGGDDPYSASKAMADILISSWSSSFPGTPVATARAGNVIGGGDIGTDRLMPDLIRGFESSKTVGLRYPNAVRPWQHVLDCLNGYVLLMEAVADGWAEGPWNFGPDQSAWKTVREVADRAAVAWGHDAAWCEDEQPHPREANMLMLDSSHARNQLGWKDYLTFDETVDWTIEWSKRVFAGESAREVSREQLGNFHSRIGSTA
jgi:CDP-glucose 4,6-dehydratase